MTDQHTRTGRDLGGLFIVLEVGTVPARRLSPGYSTSG